MRTSCIRHCDRESAVYVTYLTVEDAASTPVYNRMKCDVIASSLLHCDTRNRQETEVLHQHRLHACQLIPGRNHHAVPL